jgi:histidyl-tRNA synthetase
VKFEAPRGTHDILPSEQPRWRHVLREFELLCELYGYRRIDTPVFEDTELFARTSGHGSDVVTKEMYTFEDRGERSLTLRAEATAPIVRAYLEHGLHREPQPQKLYTHETIYRYGRPQKGRYREHWQLDVEAIGSEDPALDAEVIELYDTLLARLGVTEYRLELNSIGDAECRPAYLERLQPWLDEHASDLDEATREQASRNPLRALDNIAAKPPAVQEVLRQAPTIGDSLCDACREHFAEVRSYLDAYGVRYEVVPTLVRGLDYYTRTVFEFTSDALGAQSGVGGGGRYDGLMEQIGGARTPGMGWAAGVERMLLASPPPPVAPPPVDLYVAYAKPEHRAAAFRLAADARRAGHAARLELGGRSLKGQLKQADKTGARYVAILGDEGTSLKDMQTGEQKTVEPDTVMHHIRGGL